MLELAPAAICCAELFTQFVNQPKRDHAGQEVHRLRGLLVGIAGRGPHPAASRAGWPRLCGECRKCRSRWTSRSCRSWCVRSIRVGSAPKVRATLAIAASASISPTIPISTRLFANASPSDARNLSKSAACSASIGSSEKRGSSAFMIRPAAMFNATPGVASSEA